jgi:hypothetical protein
MMSAPLRISKPGGSVQTQVNGVGAIAAGGDSYLSRLMKMIPGEALGLYLVGSSVIPRDQVVALFVWFLLCLVSVVAVRVFGTRDSRNNLPPDWIHVLISTVAFVIWVYTIGGPFAAFHLEVPYIGSLAALGWTFFVPMIYNGPA